MKRWIGLLVVLVALLMAGAALAVPPNAYHVLHKDGALYDPKTGWNVNTPPYYQGADWAVDFLYRPGGAVAILHRDGAIWDSEYGWNLSTPPYYPGSNYARALEYVLDLSGCWCMNDANWALNAQGTLMTRYVEGYPYAYLMITQTENDITTAHHCSWTGAAWVCDDSSGTINGSYIQLSAGDPGGTNKCSWTQDLTGQVYWDYTADCLGMELSSVRSTYVCQGSSAGQEKGQFGVVDLKQKYYTGSAWVPCQCPPSLP